MLERTLSFTLVKSSSFVQITI